MFSEVPPDYKLDLTVPRLLLRLFLILSIRYIYPDTTDTESDEMDVQREDGRTDTYSSPSVDANNGPVRACVSGYA